MSDDTIIEKLRETSIIIPYYRKDVDFDYALTFNAEKFKGTKEVIIIFDEPCNINDYDNLMNMGINFVFHMNAEKHPWRNPAVVINKGIRESTGKYCIILSPETIIFDDSIKQLLKHTSDTTFACGKIIFMSYNNYEFSGLNAKKILSEHIFSNGGNKYSGPLYYGSICSTRENFFKANLYNEELYKKGWGGDDDDIRDRLIKKGIQKIHVDRAQFMHLEDIRHNNRGEYSVKQFRGCDKKYDDFIKCNREKIDNTTLKNNIAKMGFVDYEMSENILGKYNIILLVQAFNEAHHVDEFMKSVYPFVDGIIFLDDGSNDNTYELFDMNKYHKIIMKAKKQRENYNNINNRNLLLNMLNSLLITSKNEWIFWLNMDERIGCNVDIVKSIRRRLLADEYENDVLAVPFYNLWNESQYNASYPMSINGIQEHIRLFRNINEKLPYKLKSDHKIHFSLCPYNYDSYGIIPLQIKHLGRMSVEIRKNKYHLYTNVYDTQQKKQNYEHFLAKDVNLINYVDNEYYFKYYDTVINECKVTK
jgi:hypothetical protein